MLRNHFIFTKYALRAHIDKTLDYIMVEVEHRIREKDTTGPYCLVVPSIMCIYELGGSISCNYLEKTVRLDWRRQRSRNHTLANCGVTN